MNPDGTGAREVAGLADDDTTVRMYPQPIPGNGRRFVCVGTCHYAQGGCVGSIVVVDYGKGVRGRGPDPDEPGYVPGDDRYSAVNITPHVFVPRRSGSGWSFRTEDGKYVFRRQVRLLPRHQGAGRQAASDGRTHLTVQHVLRRTLAQTTGGAVD